MFSSPSSMGQLLLVPFFFIVLSAVAVQATALSQSQLDAIRALLALIPGTGVVQDPCAFSGIVCANVSGTLRQVVHVSLSNRGMVGELPSSIGALSSLTVLDLSHNYLSGALPQSMADLLSLESLNLGQPKLDRSLRMSTPPYLFLCSPPQPFFSLCLYRQQSTASNSFTGPFPDFIGGMTKLKYLNLNRNALSGQLPPSWSSLVLLEELHVSHTAISELPDWIHKLASLVVVSSFKSKLSGNIPPSITMLPKLSWLLLMENQLTGPLPAEIGTLSALTELVLLQNKLSGNIPHSIGNLSNLVALTLYGNAFTGAIPDTLARIQPNPAAGAPGLLFLSLNQNQLSGTIPANLGTLPLVILYLNENSLTGAIPSQLCSLFTGPAFLMSPNAVWLNQNKLTGELPACFGQMPNLKDLDLSSNNLAGTLPSFVAAASLKTLRISGNQQMVLAASTSLPPSLTELHARALMSARSWLLASVCGGQFKVLQLSDTPIDSELPVCVTQLTTLTILIASRCMLRGSIPKLFGTLTNLEVFDVSFNALSGTVPPSVSSLLKLKTFDISFNAFSMSAQALLQPFQLLPQLLSISFSSNFITGQLTTDLFWNLDSSIVYFPSLTTMMLSNNSVSGSLLHVMGTLPTLATIDVTSNRFEGTVPSSFNSLSVFLAANNSMRDTAASLPPFLEPRCELGCLDPCVAASNSSNQLVAACLRSCCDVVQSTHSNVICPDIRFRDNHRKVAKLDPSYSSFFSCTCAVGYFGSPPDCIPCLKNAVCDGSKFLTIRRGFYPSPNYTSVVAINECRSGSLGETSCNPDETPSFQCASGYEGRLCSRCSPGFYVENNKCTQCWAQPVIVTLFVTGLVLGLVYFVFLSLKKPDERNANGFIIMTRSILFYVQMTSVLLVNAPFRWPKKVLSLAVPYGWMQFKFGVLTCLQAGSSAAGTTSDLFLFLGPVLLAAFCVFCCGIAAICFFSVDAVSSKSVEGALFRTKSKLQTTAPGFAYAFVWGLNVLYTPITISVLSKFVCSKDPVDGQFYEYHNPWQLCSAYDAAVSLPIYALSISFYTVGIPLLYAAVAFKYRAFKAVGDDDACLRIRSLFGSIMQSYREEYFWWELVAIVRRFLICACAALLSPRVDALTLSIFVILSASLVAHVRASPFLFPLNNSLETANLAMVMFNYLAGILFSSNLLDNFDGMDIFVVIVNVIAVLFMIIAAFWVWKVAPDLSEKLGVSQHLLVPTVLSKLTHTLSRRFTVAKGRGIELQQRADAAASEVPTITGTDAAASEVPTITGTTPSDVLPRRNEHALSLPTLPPHPSEGSHSDAFQNV
jgi:Leucine-rich repeat (LRR) protein